MAQLAGAERDAQQHRVAALVRGEHVEDPVEADRVDATGDERQGDGHGQLGAPRRRGGPVGRRRRATVARAPVRSAHLVGTLREWGSRGSSVGSSGWSRARSPRPSAAVSSRSRSAASCCARWTPAARSACRATVAPNYFVVCLSPTDLERFDDYADVLERELADAAREHARDEGYHFLGPVTVELVEDRRPQDGRPAGRRRDRGGPGGRVGALVLPDGRRVTLGDEPVRHRPARRLRPSPSSDPQASRRHAEIRPDARRLPPGRPRVA